MKKTILLNILLILGIFPFLLPVILGIYHMTIESWDLLDWLILYSYIYWPTYLAGAVVIAVSIIDRLVKKTKNKNEN